MYRKKLIEVALPLAAINMEGARRKRKAPKGFPTTIHTWWAQRPLAAARAVLFAQLVDDPSAWPERFPTEEAQEKERLRLFGIIEKLVPWEASNNESVINVARLEIARDWARSHRTLKAARVLAEDVTPGEVNAYLATELPPVHDPFSGSGTIPLEAQRLGLRVIATDLNPVAVLISKALIEIPQKFAGLPPVNSESQNKSKLRTWKGAQGLAEDVRYYGALLRNEAKKLIGHLYPDVEVTPEMTRDRPDLKGLEGKKLPVTAWLWARTVASPNPALGGVHVPLVSTYWLSTKEGKESWLKPVVATDGRNYHFEVRTSPPPDSSTIDAGTKTGRATFKCILSNDVISGEYINTEAESGRLGFRMLAIVAETHRKRVYLSPPDTAQQIALVDTGALLNDTDKPSEPARGTFAGNAQGRIYGFKTFGDYFSTRQLISLTTLTSKIHDISRQVAHDALNPTANLQTKVILGEVEANSYGQAVATYIAMAISRVADYGSTLATWRPKDNAMRSSIPRQALAMSWDFAEGNPFETSSSGLSEALDVVANCLVSDAIPTFTCAKSRSAQADAQAPAGDENIILSTDPPYYDNIGYADLSDFFYIWLRRSLRTIHPDLFETMLVPKTAELIASSYRHGSKEDAEVFFTNGMRRTVQQLALRTVSDVPATIYYAFKQTEFEEEGGQSSTGWETFLEAVIAGGYSITGTWPLRTEGDNRQNAVGANALASSVVLVCRKRDPTAPTITRGDFRRALRAELPGALKMLQHGNIAPVDVAQASIGPGMAIFSRHAKVIEADGSVMTVRSALQLINEALDEYLSAEEGEVDADTRFAISWFEANEWSAGNFGDAETLARARNVAVAAIAEAGVLRSVAGKVRLLKRSELLSNWNPSEDRRLTVWEATQHLIKRIEEHGEPAAAALLKKLGPIAERARDLAYRLYNICERKGWAEDARAYNGLVIAWPELEKLAASAPSEPAAGQLGFGLEASNTIVAKKRASRPRKKKA